MEFLGVDMKTIGVMVTAGVITGILTSVAINYLSRLYVQQAKLAAKAEIQKLVLAIATQQNPTPTESTATEPVSVPAPSLI